MDNSKPKFKRRPYSKKQLAGLYHTSLKCFNRWVDQFKEELGKKCGRYYTPRQVEIIFSKLGYPDALRE